MLSKKERYIYLLELSHSIVEGEGGMSTAAAREEPIRVNLSTMQWFTWCLMFLVTLSID